MVKKYFIQTFTALPPIKWIGSDRREFVALIDEMLSKAPKEELSLILSSATWLQDHINIISFDTEELPEWDSIFIENRKYSWPRFIKNKYGSLENQPVSKPKK